MEAMLNAMEPSGAAKTDPLIGLLRDLPTYASVRDKLEALVDASYEGYQNRTL